MTERTYNEEGQLELALVADKNGRFKEKVVGAHRTKEAAAFAKMLGNNIRTARLYAGMSQSAVGKKIYGYDAKNRMSDFEAGKETPPVFVLAEIAKITGVSMDYILGISPEPALDEYGTRHGLAMAIIHDTMKPYAQRLAAMLAKAVGRIPTSPTISLIEKTKELKLYLRNVKEHTPFEKTIPGSKNLIKAIDDVVALAEKMEREVAINIRHLERAAQDSEIHDEKIHSGHLFRWEADEPTKRVVEVEGK